MGHLRSSSTSESSEVAIWLKQSWHDLKPNKLISRSQFFLVILLTVLLLIHLFKGACDLLFQATNFTFIGTGDGEACQTTVRKLFNFSVPCPNEPCTFNGTYQPAIQGDFYVSF